MKTQFLKSIKDILTSGEQANLKEIREYEIGQVLSLLPQRSTILEIGAGAGWQAKLLAEKGFIVTAIDLSKSEYEIKRVYPIIEYDGMHIPFPDKYFDVVFSSNVLEHVPNIKDFLVEIKRVLKRGGLAICLLPTGSWRLFTNISYYLFLVKRFLNFLLIHAETSSEVKSKTEQRAKKLNILHKVRNLFPFCHGVTGNFVSEVYLFSKFRWKKLFRDTGWIVKFHLPNRLFYTGHSILGLALNIKSRVLASYILGSSCHIFLLKTNSIETIKEDGKTK